MNGINHNSGPVILLILDGWGISEAGEGNAIAKAEAPNFRELVAKYPATILSVIRPATISKKISLSDNYLALGTGKKKLSSANQSLFDELENAGLKWLILTEPEKMAYGLFFINNRKKVDSGNFEILAAEPTDNYALTPAMASNLIIAELLKKIKSRKYDFIAAIAANIDLVAHSGNFTSTVEAVQVIDRSLKTLVKTVLDNSGVLIITAAHGNAEEEIEMKTEQQNKKDTLNPVPFLIIGDQFEGKSFGFAEATGGDLALVSPSGNLLDVMPTILKIMGLPIPPGLDGQPLI